MPWNDNDSIVKSVPAMKALPSAAITLFREVANRQISKGDAESTALRVAWGVVKKRFVKQGDSWVARSDAFDETTYYTFDVEPDSSFITRSEGDYELHNYILTDNLPDRFGTAPTDELIARWADQINSEQPFVDADHELFEIAKKTCHDTKTMRRMLSSKTGIAKAVRASVKDGKLLVSLAFDKRYAKHVNRVRGLSIEAAVVRDASTNRFKKGELFGFSLMMNQNPGNPRSVHV